MHSSLKFNICVHLLQASNFHRQIEWNLVITSTKEVITKVFGLVCLFVCQQDYGKT